MARTRSTRKAKSGRKTKGPFKSMITGLFISRAAASRWPKSSVSLARRRKKQ